MISIAERCVSTQKGTVKLSIGEAKALLAHIPEWNISGGTNWLSRKFIFRNFDETLAFINRVGAIAQTQNHHPDCEFGWGYALIKLQTHDAGGLHMNDFVMASKINTLL